MSEATRLLELERRTEAMARRLDRLEHAVGAVPAVAPSRPAPPSPTPDLRPPAPAATTPPPPGRPAPAPPRPVATPPRQPAARAAGAASFEDLVAGRILAWVGGAAMLLGVVFLLAIAVSNGWIGEAERTLAAAAASVSLVAFGVRLHDRAGRTDASLAAVAAGIAGGFGTLVVATEVYDLLPLSAGMALAVGTGGVATALAVRWRSQGIAALGILGALASPVLVGAPSDLGTLAFLFAASASAAGVLLWQRWDWLAVAAFTVATPQWAWWLLDGPSPGVSIAVLAAFGALNVASAVGFELRLPASRLRPSSAWLLAANAAVLAGTGWLALEQAGARGAADVWLAALALAHLGVGAAAGPSQRVSDELRLLVLALGVALADLAFALLADGPLLVAGWAAGAALFAWLGRRAAHAGATGDVAVLGVGAHVGLALGHALMYDAPPDAVLAGELTTAAVAALVALAAGCFVSGHLAEGGRPELRVALDVLGLVTAAYLAALALDGPALVAVWALQAVALAQLARRSGDPVAAWGAVAHVGAAALHVLVFEAPPSALVAGVDEPLAAALAAGVVALAALRMAQLGIGEPAWRPWLAGSGGLALLYLASVELVTPFQPGSATPAAVFDLGVRQQGQVLLSAMWSIVGVTALVVGLRRDVRPVRLAGLALLLVTVAKVFVFDLAALTSLYRVASFVALGVLLLAAAFVWQRMRPRPLPDLREAPPAIR